MNLPRIVRIDGNEKTVKKILVGREAPATLRETLKNILLNYFKHLGKDKPIDLYPMVLEEVERPMIEVLYKYTGGNQVNMARILGVSRGTLRTMLKRYDLL